MALQLADRIRETCTSPGTGNVTLLGPVTGYKSFSNGIAVGSTCYYTLADQSGANFEIGIGTLTNATTLARTQVIANNLGTTALINFSSGTQDVFIDLPSEYAVTQADVGTSPNQIPLNQYLGSMAWQDVNNYKLNFVVSSDVGTSPNQVPLNQYLNTMAYEDKNAVNIGGGNIGGLVTTSGGAISNTTWNQGTGALQVSSPVIGGTATINAINLAGGTNYLTYSQDFTNAIWIKSASSIVASATTAPDGTNTAQTFIEDITNAQHRLYYNGTTVTAGTYTCSLFIKPAGRRYISIYPSGTGIAAVCFDVISGSVVATSGANYISSNIYYVGNGWYRCFVVLTATAGTLFFSAYLNNAIGNALTYTGDGVSGAYIWGAQLETGSVATNYTSTTSSAIQGLNSLLSAGTGGIGYTTGAGGAVAQTTSRTTGVTLNKTTGAITLISAAGLPTYQSFTVTNSTVASTDTVIVNQKSGTDKYILLVTAVASGSFQITYATTGGTTIEQPVFNFAIIKGQTA
jgi:hypothetical protein